MTFERPDQPAVREVPQPDRLVFATARERPAVGRERERERRSAVRGQAVPQLAGVDVPDQDKPVVRGRGEELAPGRESYGMDLGIHRPRPFMSFERPNERLPSERSRV